MRNTFAEWDRFQENGWVRFAWDAKMDAWAAFANPIAKTAVRDPAHAEWLDCEGTWFIGVDALPNDRRGQLLQGPVLAGPAIDFIKHHMGGLPDLHPAQLSIIYPGYPQPRRGESAAAFRYRVNRDAAHVDGVKMFTEERRRRVEEPHAWVLGIPLNETPPEAAPLVVWKGSHKIMHRAFSSVFAGVEPEGWANVDVTDAYVAARKEVFETCERQVVHARPGEAYLMHRLCLHGVAPWGAEADFLSNEEGRMIAYFRPDVPGGVANWLGPKGGGEGAI